MKKNKTLLGVALLIAVLMLGVGYAALTASNLLVNGTLSVGESNENFKVVYDMETTPAVTGEDLASASYQDDTHALLNVTGLDVVGETVTATYTIVNNSNAGINADLKADPATQGATNGKYYNVTTNITKATGLTPGESTTMTVTVELVQAPLEAIEDTFTITLTATPKAA